jgi:hypothetical protein
LLAFINFFLILLSGLFFLLGYAYLNNKAVEILMWSLTGKIENMTDKEGYRRQQGKHSILMGIIFLFIPVSIYLFVTFDLNLKLLQLWHFVLASTLILNAMQLRKYFRKK